MPTPVPDFGEPTLERVRLAMDYLSATRQGDGGADEVARTLEYHGVTGVMFDAFVCPIARFLSAAFGGRAASAGLSVATVWLDDPMPPDIEEDHQAPDGLQLSVPFTLSVDAFRRGFDRGKYPGLERNVA